MSRSRPLSQKKMILVIEDNSDMRKLQKTLLELEGFSVLEASSGREGVRLLKSSQTPDLILLDVELGDMTGPQFLDQMQKQSEDILQRVPIVYVTGYDEPPDQRAKGFVKKGTNTREFVSKVREALL